jgi:hypothetical protein
MQKGHNARIIEIFFSDVISNLHAEMTRTFASAQLFARRIYILKGNLAERLEASLTVRTQFERRIVEEPGTIERVFYRTVVRKQHWSRRHHLYVNSIALHFLQAYFRIPARRIDFPEKAVTDHDVGLTSFGVFDPWPIERAVTFDEIRPCAREKVIVNIDDRHSYCLPG